MEFQLKFVGPINDKFEPILESIINLWNQPKLIEFVIREQDSYIVSFNINIITNRILNNLYRILCIYTEARFILNATIYYTITFVNKMNYLQMQHKIKIIQPWVINAPYPIYPCLFYKGNFGVKYTVEVTEGNILRRANL